MTKFTAPEGVPMPLEGLPEDLLPQPAPGENSPERQHADGSVITPDSDAKVQQNSGEGAILDMDPEKKAADLQAIEELKARLGSDKAA